VSPEQRLELSTNEVKKVLDQVAESGCLFLTLSGGEPFMRDDIFEIAAHAKKRGFALRFFTNGTLIDEEMAEQLAALNVLDVGISLYGAKSKTHEMITDVRGSFRRSLQAFRLLKQRNIRTVLKFTVMKQNLNEFQAVKELAEKVGAYFQFGFALFPKTNGSKENLALRLGEEGLQYLLRNEILYSREGMLRKQEQNLKKKDIGKRTLCSAGRDMCAISPYGDLMPCVTLPIKVGNLREIPFGTLWTSSAELIHFRQLRCSDLKGCPECPSYGNCYRCPGLALLEHGDMLGPCEFACQIEEIERSLVN